MKKSTLIVVVVAIALGAFVYFYDSRHTRKTSAEETFKPAFSAKPADFASITLKRKSDTAVLQKKGSDWELSKPVESKADSATVDGITADLRNLEIQRSFAAGDDLSKYGLATPAAKIEFQDTKGAQHTIALGDKDFSGTSVYAMIDNSKPQSIALIPASLLDDVEKPVNDLRDRSIVDMSNTQVTALTLHDSSGSIQLKKAQAGWEITEPHATLADSEAVDSMVSSLSTDKFTKVASETPADLAKYGLAHPDVTLDATAKDGKQFHLAFGKKGTDYYGRDLSRPIIFSVDSTIYNSFDKKFFDLRDKEILHVDPTNVTSVTVQNANGLIECSQGKTDEWSMVQPAADKGKSVQGWKLTDPIENARATEIYDAPSAAILAHLKEPLITVTFTDKSGKKTTVEISAADKDSVYVKTSDAPPVYKLNKQILTDLGFKPSDLLT